MSMLEEKHCRASCNFKLTKSLLFLPKQKTAAALSFLWCMWRLQATGGVELQQAPQASAYLSCVGVAADWEQPNFKELRKVTNLNVLLNQSARSRAAPCSAAWRKQRFGCLQLGPLAVPDNLHSPPASLLETLSAIPARMPGPNERAQHLPHHPASQTCTN